MSRTPGIRKNSYIIPSIEKTYVLDSLSISTRNRSLYSKKTQKSALERLKNHVIIYHLYEIILWQSVLCYSEKTIMHTLAKNTKQHNIDISLQLWKKQEWFVISKKHSSIYPPPYTNTMVHARGPICNGKPSLIGKWAPAVILVWHFEVRMNCIATVEKTRLVRCVEWLVPDPICNGKPRWPWSRENKALYSWADHQNLRRSYI